MFHVLGERWGWQEKAARQWLAHYQGTAAYDEARAKAGSAALDEEPALEPGDRDSVGAPDDEDMN
jgi:hypothetical protein